MKKGDVYFAPIWLPDRDPAATDDADVEKQKLHIILQGGGTFDRLTDVAVVLGSTDDRPDLPARPFEVKVGSSAGFKHDTVIDCRSVYTIPKRRLGDQPLFSLPRDVVYEITLGLVAGLQLR